MTKFQKQRIDKLKREIARLKGFEEAIRELAGDGKSGMVPEGCLLEVLDDLEELRKQEREKNEHSAAESSHETHSG